MLDQADVLLKSISDTRLQTVVDESFKAFNGTGPELQQLIDSSRLFVQEAQANSEHTTAARPSRPAARRASGQQ